MTLRAVSIVSCVAGLACAAQHTARTSDLLFASPAAELAREVFPALPDPRQISARSGGYGASDFPTDGSSFLLMSSGDPDAPAQGLDVDFGTAGCVDDNVQIVFTFDFPDPGDSVSPVRSIKFDFDFFSYEFPEFVDMGFRSTKCFSSRTFPGQW